MSKMDFYERKKFKEIIINGEVIGYKMINNTSVPYIDYNDFKKDYKKNMEYNFKKLNSRVIDSLYIIVIRTNKLFVI